MDFFPEDSVIMDYGLVFWPEVMVQCWNRRMKNMLIDALELCGLLFIRCLDSHSDGTHSLQRINKNKWCNAKILQICSHEGTNSSVPWMAWGWVHFQHFWVRCFFKDLYYLLSDVYLGGQSRRLHGCGWLIGLGRWWQIEWGISWPSDVRHRTFLIWVPLLPQEALHVLHSPKRHSNSKRQRETQCTHS